MNRETNEELPADLAASLARGLADSAAGRVHDAGDFTQYAEDSDEAVTEEGHTE